MRGITRGAVGNEMTGREPAKMQIVNIHIVHLEITELLIQKHALGILLRNFCSIQYNRDLKQLGQERQRRRLLNF